MNFIDNLIGYVNPSAALKRQRARLALDYFSKRRKYEGASKSKRLKDFRSTSSSANEEIKSALVTLRNRSRDLVRNNSLASSAIDKIETNLVGDGIVAQFFLYDKNMISGAALLEKIQTDWYRWVESEKFSVDGQLSFYGSQLLSSRSEIEGGEAISRRLFNSKSPSGIQIQLLEPDFLDTDRNEVLKNGNIVIQGVEVDRNGSRAAYWLFSEHPGDSSTRSFESKRYSAEDIHCSFDPWRIGQARGVPWLAPVIVKMRDFDKYQDFQLVRQELAAAFVGVITRDVDDENLKPEDMDEFDDIQPGLFYRGRPGEDVKFSDPPGLEGYKDFSLITSQHIAAGLGITYEGLTGDYSQVNYTSSRASKYDLQSKMRKCRIKYVYPKLNRYFNWFIEAQKIKGSDYSGVGVNWIPPRAQLLDPLKEIAANSEAIQTGQTSLSQVIRESGYDPEEIFQEISRERTRLKELGIEQLFTGEARKLAEKIDEQDKSK